MAGWLLLLIGIAGAATIASPGGSPPIRDLEGRLRQPYAPSGAATVLVFVTTDCPISNSYAPEIQSLCRAASASAVDCLLLYEDARITVAQARTHRDSYGLGRIPAAIDDRRVVATAAAATVTPEAAVVDRSGAVRYLGRIDDLYADLGRRRAAPTTRDLRDAIDAVVAGRPVVNPRTPALGCYIAPPWKAKGQS